MMVSENLRYSSGHQWVAVDGDTIRVGITDYAQDALGEVLFVEVPVVGAEVTADNSFAEVESSKSDSEVYAPMSGEIIEVNSNLDGRPLLHELGVAAPRPGHGHRRRLSRCRPSTGVVRVRVLQRSVSCMQS